ncbi:hypothetical protein Dimus_001248 [Dionaea muscipula]
MKLASQGTEKSEITDRQNVVLIKKALMSASTVEDNRQIFGNNMKYINSPSSYHGIQDAFKHVYKGALDIH